MVKTYLFVLCVTMSLITFVIGIEVACNIFECYDADHSIQRVMNQIMSIFAIMFGAMIVELVCTEIVERTKPVQPRRARTYSSPGTGLILLGRPNLRPPGKIFTRPGAC